MVLVYTQGAFLHWRTIAWISLVYSLLPLVLMFFWSVESPIWLVSKGKTDRALEAFQFLLRKDKVSCMSLNLSQVKYRIYKPCRITSLNMDRYLHCFLFLQSCFPLLSASNNLLYKFNYNFQNFCPHPLQFSSSLFALSNSIKFMDCN